MNEYLQETEAKIDLSRCETRIFDNDNYDDEKWFYQINKDNIIVVKTLITANTKKIWFYYKDDGIPILK